MNKSRRYAKTYQGKLEKYLPYPKVVKSTFVTSLGEEILEVAIFTKFGLNVQMILRLPAVDALNNVVASPKSFEYLNFFHLAFSVSGTNNWVLCLLHRPHATN
jgi:hypothetical protein